MNAETQCKWCKLVFKTRGLTRHQNSPMCKARRYAVEQAQSGYERGVFNEEMLEKGGVPVRMGPWVTSKQHRRRRRMHGGLNLPIEEAQWVPSDLVPAITWVEDYLFYSDEREALFGLGILLLKTAVKDSGFCAAVAGVRRQVEMDGADDSIRWMSELLVEWNG